jgi:hypothetical protein
LLRGAHRAAWDAESRMSKALKEMDVVVALSLGLKTVGATSWMRPAKETCACASDGGR